MAQPFQFTFSLSGASGEKKDEVIFGVSNRSGDRRRQHKATDSIEDIWEKRRKDILERQKTSRRDAVAILRKMKSVDDEVEYDQIEIEDRENEDWLRKPSKRRSRDVEMGDDEFQSEYEGSQGKRIRKTRKKKVEDPSKFANQLMVPVQFSSISATSFNPSELSNHWVIMPLPPVSQQLSAGGLSGCVRCVIFSTRRGGVARRQDGTVVARFRCALPLDSVVDGLIDFEQRKCFVLDMICWKEDFPMLDYPAEFRLFWRDQKIAEEPALQESSWKNRFQFVPLPAMACTPQGLEQAYSMLKDPTRDYCLIVNKETWYYPGPEPNPLTLAICGEDIPQLAKRL